MSKKAQTFYFDESGFTGNNLLDPQQPVFVYAGVAIDEELASQIHADALSRFRINAQELKGANLIKYSRGRSAISWILDKVSQNAHVMVANKEYALAGKFFEYIFEPILTKHNSLFYAIDFHKFVATLLHLFSVAGDNDANDILADFAGMMSSMDPGQFEAVLSHLDRLDLSTPLGKILTFACCHEQRIKNELRVVRETGPVASWSLELSMTALHWLLISWGEQFEVLDVYCDESKPIEASRQFFDVFVGRKDKAYLRFGNQSSHSIIYNLEGPIKMVNSKESHGVQIADILSSSLAYALENPDEEIAKEWLSITKDVYANQIIPDSSYVDLMEKGTYVNTWVLNELVDRSVKGQDLFENMADIIAELVARYPQYIQYLTETTPADF